MFTKFSTGQIHQNPSLDRSGEIHQKFRQHAHLAFCPNIVSDDDRLSIKIMSQLELSR